jgi:thioredoxin-like negative regulator of GroEL
MNNDEAKEIYSDGVQKMESGEYAEALVLFDQLEAERPNSKHVAYHRAQCLIRLKRPEEARECCAKLDGKLEADKLSILRKQIESLAPAAAPAAPPANNGDNVFLIESSYPISTTETSVTGLVESGALRPGETLSIIPESGLPIMAPILRIGTEDTPLQLIRAGQKTMMLLQVEPSRVKPGLRASSTAQEEAYAKTMVASTDAPSAAPSDTATELAEAERRIKKGDYAHALPLVEAYLSKDPNSITAHRLLAMVHLDSPDHKDVGLALKIIQKAYEMGGADNALVINVLSDALAHNGEADQGVRFLERLYGNDMVPEARMALAQRIQDFRTKHKLGHVWEFADEYGEVVFQASTIEEAVKAIKSGSVPKESKCRRDRLGDWRPIETTVAPDHPEIAVLFQASSKQRSNTLFFVLAAVLVVAIVAVLFFIRK